MRQVPRFTQYALLGSGRVARHFSHYFETLRLPFWVWTDARNLESGFFERLRGTSHLFLLVSDAALAEVLLKIRTHPQWLMMPESERPLLLHASGATVLEDAIAVHPLMTFPRDRLYAKEFYPRIPLTLFLRAEEWGSEGVSLASLLPGLPNPVQVLRPEDQPLYHALCVVYGNLPQLLWNEAESIRARLPISRESLRPFLEATLENFLASPSASLTGPFVRGDAATVGKHLDALSNTPLLPLYSAFVDRFFSQKQFQKSEGTQS